MTANRMADSTQASAAPQSHVAEPPGDLASSSPFGSLDRSPDLSEVYTQLIGTLREHLICSGIAILVPSSLAIAVPAQYGPQPLPTPIVLSVAERHILTHITRTGRTLTLRRPAAFRPPLPAPASDLAWIGAPIMIGDRLCGCLSMVGNFRSNDERLALSFAQQAATTLDWALRYHLAERQTRQARLLIDLDQRIEQTNDSIASLDLILAAAMALTGAAHGCILTIQHWRASLLVRRGYTQEEATLLMQIPPSLDRGLTGRAYRTRSIVRSGDILQDPEALPALSGTRAHLVIPIYSADQIYGLIDLQSPQPDAFHATDDPLLHTLGRRAAAIIGQQRTELSVAHTSDGVPAHDLLLASRLAVVTDLAAGVAHEINNPLTTILGYTHLLLRDQSLPQAARDDMGQIMIEGQRIATLVERFLRFAQTTSSGKQPLSIGEPLLDALELLKSQLQESDVQIEIDIPADPLLILGQSAQLEQAFVDLLQNAMEAMETSDERKIQIRVNEQNKWVRVSIADTGRGIRPDLLTRIFEPGFTTKVDKGISRGLGLGLYATHTIIQNHWGRIDVHSQVWQGSTFTVYLPAI